MSQDNVEPVRSQSHTQTPEHRDADQLDHDTQPIIVRLSTDEADPKQITAEMPEVSIRNELDEISRNIEIERAADRPRLQPRPETLVSRGRHQLLYKTTRRATIVSVAVYAAVLLAGVTALISVDDDNGTRASSAQSVLDPIPETKDTKEPPAKSEKPAGPERPIRPEPDAPTRIGPSKAPQGKRAETNGQTPSKVSSKPEPTTTTAAPTTPQQETTTTSEAVTTTAQNVPEPLPASTTSTVAEKDDLKKKTPRNAREERRAKQKARQAERQARRQARKQARLERIRQQREDRDDN